MKNCIQLAACEATELLPMIPDLPADLFTSCLTTPIKIALRWGVAPFPGHSPGAQTTQAQDWARVLGARVSDVTPGSSRSFRAPPSWVGCVCYLLVFSVWVSQMVLTGCTGKWTSFEKEKAVMRREVI